MAQVLVSEGRSGLVDVRRERVDVRRERVDVQPERVDVRRERVNARPERVDVKPEPAEVRRGVRLVLGIRHARLVTLAIQVTWAGGAN